MRVICIYISISNSWHFILLVHYISEGNNLLITLQIKILNTKHEKNVKKIYGVLKNTKLSISIENLNLNDCSMKQFVDQFQLVSYQNKIKQKTQTNKQNSNTSASGLITD